MKAYSTDLRKRVLAAWDCGQYMLKDIARMFSVSERWILLLRRLREQTGGIEPRVRNSGRKPAFRGKALQELEDFVAAYPDATLAQIKEFFAGRVDCSVVTIHNTLKARGWRYKKKRYEPPSRTEKT